MASSASWAGRASRSTRFMIVPACSPTIARMRRGREIADRRRVPVITPRQPAGFVHPLLHDRPVAVARQDERVQIDLKAVGDRIVVDARGEPAGADQRVAIEADALGDRTQLAGCVARLLAASAADVDAELVRARIESSLQRAHHRRGDAGGVPVHAHHRSERLEPERIAQPRQQRRPAVVQHHALADRGAERGHARAPATTARARRAAGGRRHPIASSRDRTRRVRRTGPALQLSNAEQPCPTGERARALAP